jgi:hypothetical protein
LTNTSRICAFPALRAHRASSWSRYHTSKQLFFDGKCHRVILEYGRDWIAKAFIIIYGGHLKPRLDKHIIGRRKAFLI